MFTSRCQSRGPRLHVDAHVSMQRHRGWYSHTSRIGTRRRIPYRKNLIREQLRASTLGVPSCFRTNRFVSTSAPQRQYRTTLSTVLQRITLPLMFLKIQRIAAPTFRRHGCVAQGGRVQNKVQAVIPNRYEGTMRYLTSTRPRILKSDGALPLFRAWMGHIIRSRLTMDLVRRFNTNHSGPAT